MKLDIPAFAAVVGVHGGTDVRVLAGQKAGRGFGQGNGAAEAVESKSPVELFSEFFELQNNRPMSEEQREIASGIIEKIWEEQQ